MAVKEFIWTFTSKATVPRGTPDSKIYSTVPTIVKNDLEQNATKQGKYLRVIGDPKVKITKREPHAPIVGLYGHEDVTFSCTTTIHTTEASPFIIAVPIVLAILAIIKIAIVAIAIVLVTSNVKETAKVFEAKTTTKKTVYDPKTGQYTIIEEEVKEPKIPEAPVTTTISLGIIAVAIIVVVVALFYFKVVKL